MIDEELRAAALAIIAVIGVAAVSQAIVAERVVEPFSALGTLGPNMKLDDYPKTVLVNETFRLYLYVENQEGRVMFYELRVKLGNNSTVINETVPADLPVLKSYYVILPHGANETIPADISIAAPATDVKLIIEMWVHASNGTYYNGRWNHFWMNVTAPAL
ncbi:MAG: DUF1616 domain-containing protein [Candidatus Methanosuratus sp.]|nr:DUF1616 domain-containing protein [Candidatus Methanosuratincola sp.]